MGHFQKMPRFVAKPKTGRFAKTIHICATKNKKLSNFAEKGTFPQNALVFFAKPKTGRLTKSEIFVYLREFTGKFETVQMGYYGAGGKLFNEKN